MHGITPEPVRNAVHQGLEITKKAEESAPAAMSEDERNALMKQLEDQMLSAAKALVASSSDRAMDLRMMANVFMATLLVAMGLGSPGSDPVLPPV